MAAWLQQASQLVLDRCQGRREIVLQGARARALGAAVFPCICGWGVLVDLAVDVRVRIVGDQPYLLVREPDHGRGRRVRPLALGGLRDREGQLRGWRDVATLGNGVAGVERRGRIVGSRSSDSAEDAGRLGVAFLVKGPASSAAESSGGERRKGLHGATSRKLVVMLSQSIFGVRTEGVLGVGAPGGEAWRRWRVRDGEMAVVSRRDSEERKIDESGHGKGD